MNYEINEMEIIELEPVELQGNGLQGNGTRIITSEVDFDLYLEDLSF